MTEIFLGDRDLQDLLQKTGVSLEWDKSREQRPVIHILFPVSEDISSLRTICSVCQRPAIIDYTSETDHRFLEFLGILVKKDNLGVYRVVDCEFSKMSREDIKKGKDDLALGIDSPASKAFEEMCDSPCINNSYVNYPELMSTAGLVLDYFAKCFKKRQLSLRSPSFQQIQAALR